MGQQQAELPGDVCSARGVCQDGRIEGTGVCKCNEYFSGNDCSTVRLRPPCGIGEGETGSVAGGLPVQALYAKVRDLRVGKVLVAEWNAVAPLGALQWCRARVRRGTSRWRTWT
jgi:hypothetical protein